LPTACNSFPDYEYLDIVFDFLEHRPTMIPTANTRIRLLPKARKLLMSWAVIGKLVHACQTKEHQEVIVQSKTEDDGIYLIDYAKTLYKNQPEWLKRAYPLKDNKDLSAFPMTSLEWANGSFIEAIPQGASKLNTRHPSYHFMDEASFHDEGREAYNSSVAASSFIIVVSSAYPGWFHELLNEDQFPLHGKRIATGVAYTETNRGLPALWIHHTAHPERRSQEWRDAEEMNYTSKAEFSRQQDINFTAGGGEKVLRERLETRWNDIVITDPEWRPHSEWNYDAGFDYGKNHPTAFEVLARDRDGVMIAVQEHYQSKLTPGEHAQIIRKMRLPCAGEPLTLDKIGLTWADPSIFPDTVAGDDKFTSYQQLLEANGSLKLVKGLRGMDLWVADEILRMWPAQGEIRFKIWCPKPITRKAEGTYQQGCPNLLWELLNLRRREVSPTVAEKKGQPEGLVDTKNDAFDALKYLLTGGGPRELLETDEERWRNRVAEIKKRNPKIGVMGLNRQYMKFAAEMAKEEVVTYR